MSERCDFEVVEGNCTNTVEPVDDDPRSELFCSTHCDFGWRVCAGCGGSSVRECTYEDELGNLCCRAPLCKDCDHHPQAGHIRRGSELPQGDPISTPSGQSAIEALRNDLTKSIKDSLDFAQEQGLPNETAASLILSNLGLHVTFQMLSGMAAHPPE